MSVKERPKEYAAAWRDTLDAAFNQRHLTPRQKLVETAKDWSIITATIAEAVMITPPTPEMYAHCHARLHAEHPAPHHRDTLEREGREYRIEHHGPEMEPPGM